MVAPAVDVLAGMRAELLNRIQRAIQAWEIFPVSALLFGSTARGDGSTTSDIDLFVVRSRDVGEEDAVWRAQVDDLATQVERWTGNHAGIAEVGEAEIGQLCKKEPPIVTELRSDAIVLAGLDIPALLSAE